MPPTASKQNQAQYEDERNLVRKLLVACEKDDLETVQLMQKDLARKNLSVCDYRDGKRAGAIHAAARGGAIKTLEYLLSLKPEQGGLQDGEGRTPLLAACSSEAGADCVRFLLERNQAAKDSANVSSHGSAAIHHAASLDSDKALEYLLEIGGADPSAPSEAGTPLHWAAAHASTSDTTVALLKTKKVDVDARTSEGSTPLLIASLRGKTEIVKALCNGGADLNTFAGNLSPLIAAVVAGNLDCVQAIVAKGGEPLIMQRDPVENLLPIEHAAHAGHAAIVEHLAAKSGMAGIDVKAYIKKIQDDYEQKLQAEAKQTQEADRVATEIKEAGNKLFLAQNYTEAIAKYEEASKIPNISSDMKATLLSNVSACYLKLEQPQKARETAEDARDADRKHVKAYYRLGQACAALKDHEAAAHAYYDAYEVTKGTKEAEGFIRLFKLQIDLGKKAHVAAKKA